MVSTFFIYKLAAKKKVQGVYFMKGTVKWYSDQKGFGFIKPDEGEKDLFFHRTNVKSPNSSLSEGQRVEFEITKGPKGPEATNVRLGE